jgi:Cytochrome c7 and related cytochrome c
MANFFPRWTNYLAIKIVFCLLVFGGAASAAYWWYLTPEYMRQGYQPVQPVPFPHDIHVTQLGLDCRYCHSYVQVSSASNVPTTQTCMNCHQQVQKDNPKLWAVKQSWETGQPMHWVRVHQIPDFAYFNHAVHVNRGISCVSCHGDVNHMDVVYQHEPLTMGWCLNCHRHPEENLRPVNQVFNLDWKPSSGESQQQIGTELQKQWNINPPQNCAGCHR